MGGDVKRKTLPFSLQGEEGCLTCFQPNAVG
jgi:hypothetical protein